MHRISARTNRIVCFGDAVLFVFLDAHSMLTYASILVGENLCHHGGVVEIKFDKIRQDRLLALPNQLVRQ